MGKRVAKVRSIVHLGGEGMATSRMTGAAGRFVGYVRSLAEGTGSAILRFPVATLLICAFSLILDLTVANIYVAGRADTFWLLASLYAAAAASVVGEVAAEGAGGSRFVRLAASVLAACAIGFPVWHGLSLAVFPVPLIAAATLAIPLAPYVARRDSMRFWVFVFWTSIGVVLAFLSVLLFVLGLSAIIEMVRFLFAVGPGDRAYEHLFVVAFSLVGPLFALGRIPADFDDARTVSGDDRLVSGVRILFDWIAAPLALVTSLVLHVYAAKIAVTGEVPKNEIGWIVTFFSIFVLSLRIALGPFAKDGGVATRLFARVFAVVLVVPLALLFYAAAMRIGAEGLTVERYYLALSGIATAIIVLLQAVPWLRADLRVMAGVPVALLALSSFGPWGVVETVGRSQSALFAQEFEASRSSESSQRSAGNGAPDMATSPRLRSRLYALDDVRQLDRVAPLLDDEARGDLLGAVDDRPEDAIEVALEGFGLARPTPVAPTRFVEFQAPDILDLSGYDRMLGSRTIGEGRRPAEGADAAAGSSSPTIAAITIDDDRLRLRIGTAEDAFALDPLIEAATASGDIGSSSDRAAPAFDVDLTSAAGRRIKLAIGRLGLSTAGGRSRVVSATLTVYFSAAQWTVAP